MSRQEGAISGNFAAHPGDAVENSSARSLNNGLISDGDPCFFEIVGGKRGRPENMTLPSKFSIINVSVFSKVLIFIFIKNPHQTIST